MSHWTDKAISGAYAAFRPAYPAALLDFVASRSPRRGLGLDVGCGTGQVAKGLAAAFHHVHGVDPSATQLQAAFAAPNVSYSVGDASSFYQGQVAADASSPSAGAKADLVTVAQAMHWFDIPAFEAQLSRHLAPDGVLCAWMYPLLDVVHRSEANAVFKHLDHMMMAGGHWPPERRHIDNRYVELLPKFREFRLVDERSFFDVKDVTVSSFVNYLGTMSGIDRYVKSQNIDKSEFLGKLHDRFSILASADVTCDDDGSTLKSGMLRLRHEFLVFTLARRPSAKL